MKLLSIVTLLIFTIVCSSCSKKDYTSYTHINSKPAVLISHDEAGSLIGFLVLSDTDNIKSVEISPSKGLTDVHITPFGTKLHEAVTQNDISVSSNSVDEGFFGYVTANFDSGTLIQLFGNTVHMPSPITSDTLNSVDQMIGAGTEKYPEDLPMKIKLLSTSDSKN